MTKKSTDKTNEFLPNSSARAVLATYLNPHSWFHDAKIRLHVAQI